MGVLVVSRHGLSCGVPVAWRQIIMTDIVLLGVLLLMTSTGLVYLVWSLNRERGRVARSQQAQSELTRQMQGVSEADAERQRIVAGVESQRSQALARLAEVQRTNEDLRRCVESAAEDDRQRRSVIAELQVERSQVQARLAEADRTIDDLRRRFHPGADIEREQQRIIDELASKRALALTALSAVQREVAQARLEGQAIEASIEGLRRESSLLDEEATLHSFGFYQPRYNFAESAQYQERLEDVRDRQKALIKEKRAATCAIEWAVNGSKAEGRKQINQTLKLMLRAFNGESDAAIAKVRYNNFHVMEARIRKAHEMINGLAEVQSCVISAEYLDLKLQELALVHEYEEKVQGEKEEQRRIREQMREEELALREIEKARLEAEKEESRFAEALRKAQEEVGRAAGAKQEKLLTQIEELERRLQEAHVNKARAVSRAQMTRSGHVYIISNIGSFGEDVFKIGMTRRLVPMDRVKELGDASVPFEFDVHAILYADDAPALETMLHRAFNHRRVNRVNGKKEFFRLGLAEIIEFVQANHSAEVTVTHTAEAAEYRKTLALLQEERGVA